MKIGYQGEVGSNALEASKQLYSDEMLIPLTTSKNVVRELVEGNIDIGVLAIKNSITGDVVETIEALKGIDYKIIDYVNIPIHHCLFRKKGNCNLKYVASHIQALKQTRIWREYNYPNLKEMEMVDTAIAARLLSEGKLDASYAVICRSEAGMMYDLELIASNIEDDKSNTTTFIVIRL